MDVIQNVMICLSVLLLLGTAFLVFVGYHVVVFVVHHYAAIKVGVKVVKAVNSYVKERQS